MAYKTFNRHKLFTVEDLQNVRESISNLTANGMSYTPLDNSLHGLYDGYLYEGIGEELYQVLDFQVFCNLTKTLKKITDHIEANGESVTLV